MDLANNSIIIFISFAAGLIVSVSAAIAIITKWFKKQVKVIVKEVVDEALCVKNDEFNKSLEELTKKIDTFMLGHTEDHAIIKEALMNIAQDRISQAHDYYMRKRSISEMSLYFIEKLYQSYKKLNGNGHVDGLMEDLRRLYKNQYTKKQDGDQ